MRILLSGKERAILFGGFEHRLVRSLSNFAGNRFSLRTYRDWKRGVYSMPQYFYKEFLKRSGQSPRSFYPVLLKDGWHLQSAAKKGGYARIKKRGNPGTPEGRRKGGIISCKAQHSSPGRFRVLKKIKKPKKSEELAELVGIMIGDGHLSDYQCSYSTNSITDIGHAQHVVKLFSKIFKLKSHLSVRKNENAAVVTVSSRAAVLLLNKIGMPIGNKISNKVCVPEWVWLKKSYRIAFLRGLFDTDGSFYVDRRKGIRRDYANAGWTITSYAGTLISGIINLLQELGFNPTHRDTQRSVFLRRREEIDRYFKEIGTHNPKHFHRYDDFRRSGRVVEGAVLEKP